MSAGTRPYAVLVVEDDAILRLHAIDIVEEAGFTAIEAKDADEAIAVLESRTDITLLFTDIHMPGSMDGVKLAHAVRNRWPPVKIVVVSGHKQVDQDELPQGSRFFSKPFQSDKMIAELRKLIGT
ncbi:response regulator [Bradyrhizobium sp. OK095]|jgi:DNA-binding NtrC family response regulator|uniref:response regulator n=1 Tax=Bradyrhizobium sp. OK095 TaxID=1882760 RepID=UPI0008CFAD42|nr:response regulator [Bradyrhizobium sp. OK095]SEM23741.1 Response regulator receiver domain-containing protein [Bradyrhizobium sp. OK095]